MIPYYRGNFVENQCIQINLRVTLIDVPTYRSHALFERSGYMGDDSDNFSSKGSVARNFSIPFLNEITKYDSKEGIKFKIDAGGAGKSGKDLVQWFLRRRTENLVRLANKR